MSAPKSDTGLVFCRGRMNRRNFHFIMRIVIFDEIEWYGSVIFFLVHKNVVNQKSPDQIDGNIQLLCHFIGAAHGTDFGEVLGFIKDVGTDNIFINFDPANLILYGIGDPLGALKKVGPYVRSVHCKDATATKGKPGVDWGAEVPFGTGEVNAEAFLNTLKEIDYDGPLTIEREIPQEPARQKEEIGQAVNLINSLKQKIWG